MDPPFVLYWCLLFCTFTFHPFCRPRVIQGIPQSSCCLVQPRLHHTTRVATACLPSWLNLALPLELGSQPPPPKKKAPKPLVPVVHGPRSDGVCPSRPGKTVHPSIPQLQAKVEETFTVLVWQKLEEQNPDFFRAYYTRLKLKDQIVLFNHLLEQQVAMVQKMQRGLFHPMGPWSGAAHLPQMIGLNVLSCMPNRTKRTLLASVMFGGTQTQGPGRSTLHQGASVALGR
jgi:Plant protein 1589 of unknown function (A_thal_3526)